MRTEDLVALFLPEESVRDSVSKVQPGMPHDPEQVVAKVVGQRKTSEVILGRDKQAPHVLATGVTVGVPRPESCASAT